MVSDFYILQFIRQYMCHDTCVRIYFTWGSSKEAVIMTISIIHPWFHHLTSLARQFQRGSTHF